MNDSVIGAIGESLKSIVLFWRRGLAKKGTINTSGVTVGDKTGKRGRGQERERGGERDTGRQTDRQTDRHTYITQRQIDSHNNYIVL